MSNKSLQQPSWFSRVIVILCLIALLAPTAIVFFVDVPVYLQKDWALWAMGIYSAGILRLLSVSMRF